MSPLFRSFNVQSVVCRANPGPLRLRSKSMTRETPSMLLLVVDGASQNETVINHSPFTIGRLPDRDLVLSYPYISRAHAEIVYEGDKFHLVDQGSRSGCYVNGTRVERHALNNNDVIHIGSLDGPLLRFGTPESSRSTLRSLLQQMQHASKPDSDLEKLSWFLEAARKLNDVGAVHEILVSLIETTLQLTQVERGYVFLKDPSGHLKLSVARNVHGEPLEEDSTISHSAIKRAIESDSEFIVTDTLSAEAGSPSQSMVAQSIRTVICIPLLRKRSAEQKMSDRDLLGMLYLDSRQQRGKLTRIDSDLLKTIATEAAVLVENTSLAHAEEAARHYREELTIAADIQRGLMAVRIPGDAIRARPRKQHFVQRGWGRLLRRTGSGERPLCNYRGHFRQGNFGGLACVDVAGAGACADHGGTAAGEDCDDCQPVHLREESSKVRDARLAEADFRWGTGVYELRSRTAAVTNCK